MSLAGGALDECRRHVQREIHRRRRCKKDRIYAAGRPLNASVGFLKAKEDRRLTALFTDDAHVQVEATWGVYQRMTAAYRHKDRAIDQKR